MTPNLRLTEVCCVSVVVGMLSTAKTEASLAQQGSARVNARLPAISVSRTRVDYGVILTPHLVLFNTDFGDVPLGGESVVRLAAGPGGRFIVDYTAAARPASGSLDFVLHVGLSRLNGEKFFGFGNNTAATGSATFYEAHQSHFVVEPMLTHTTPNGLVSWSFGPVLKYTGSENIDEDRFGLRDDDDDDEITLIQTEAAYGVGHFSQLGAQTNIRIGSLDPRASTGLQAKIGASAYPAFLDVTQPFGSVFGEVRGFLSVSGPASPTLAVRAGAQKVMGEPPFFEAAYLGGAGSLRGFRRQRFAGDVALFGGAELRVPLGQVSLFRHSTRFGVLALTDVGRVYYDGKSPGGWHAAVGGGLWIQPSGWSTMLNLEVAQGSDGSRAYLRMGLVF